MWVSVMNEVDVTVRRTDSVEGESGGVATILVTGVREPFVVAAVYG